LRPANKDKSNFIYFGEATLTGKKKKYTSLNNADRLKTPHPTNPIGHKKTRERLTWLLFVRAGLQTAVCFWCF
jgi:hypothetical protein